MSVDETIIQKSYAAATYVVSTGLVFDGFMNYLNENSRALGVIIGVATYCMSWWYQQKRLKNSSKENLK